MIEHPLVREIRKSGYPKSMTKPLKRRVEEDSLPAWKRYQEKRVEHAVTMGPVTSNQVL